MKSKKLLSFLLAAVMTISLLPTFAITASAAATTEKNITLGTAALSGYDSTNGYDYIYYGTYNSNPIKWRVLDNKTNFDSDNDGTNDDGLFMLSDALLGTGNKGDVCILQEYHSVYEGSDTTLDRAFHKGKAPADGVHDNCQNANVYQGSDAQSWCKSFYDNNLSSQEQSAILATTKTDKEITLSTSPAASATYNASENILNGDNVFFLSAEEVGNENYGFADNPARIAEYGGSAAEWWLRSPLVAINGSAAIAYSNQVGIVTKQGNMGGLSINNGRAARPAFNLDSSKILFTSAADGKRVNSEGGNSLKLSPNADYTISGDEKYEYKLTLLDASRNFSIEEKTATGDKNKPLYFNYKNARTGGAEFISAMIVDDSNKVLYYDQVVWLDSDANGRFAILIPSDIDYGTYELRFFNEQLNGDCRTDYSSDFETVTLNVEKPKATFTKEPTAKTLTYNGAEQALVTEGTSSEGTVMYSLEENGTYTTDIPKGKKADTYTVWYYIKGDTDHADSGKAYVEVKVAEKPINTAITLTAPVKNTAPQKSIVTGEYTATVKWSPDIPDGGEFAANTEYTATITITPEVNYTTYGITDYVIAGAESVTLNADGTVTAVFPKTERNSGGGSLLSCYTVRFDTDGADAITSQTVAQNGKATEPAEPAKEGFLFDGWYTDNEFTTEYDFDTKVTKNITLYAKWAEDEIQEPGDDNNDDSTGDDEQQPATDEWINPFTDVTENDWFFDSVRYVNENGLMSGMGENTFEPEALISRGMFAATLYRLEGEPAIANKSIPFADVAADSYYFEAVSWAQQNGIVNGLTETEFAPDENITREQIAVILYKYAKAMGYDVSVGEATNILSYTDFDEISEYAIEAMQYAVGSGLMKGKTESTLNPKDNATRAEAAAILGRFIESNK